MDAAYGLHRKEQGGRVRRMQPQQAAILRARRLPVLGRHA